MVIVVGVRATAAASSWLVLSSSSALPLPLPLPVTVSVAVGSAMGGKLNSVGVCTCEEGCTVGKRGGESRKSTDALQVNERQKHVLKEKGRKGFFCD